MTRSNVAREIYDVLLEEGAILDDPDSFCLLVEQMMLPCDPVAADQAVQDLFSADPVLVQPWGKASVLACAWAMKEHFSPSAIASLFRTVWVKHGVFAATEDLLEIIDWIKSHDKRRAYLMTEEEASTLESLPDVVRVFRGQLVNDDPRKVGITGHSWSLNGEIADLYTAREGTENGWLIEAVVPREHVHVLFLERGEHEVIIDIRRAQIISVGKGTAKEFPEHLAEPGDSFLAFLAGR